jgi:N-methylhydantoinase A/oxoprolinase/acetone carboxylase beta subunit
LPSHPFKKRVVKRMATDERKLGLGIDTGGTYTDAAIVDLESKEVVAKAKAPTTYHDLAQGLVQAVEAATSRGGFEPSEVRLVGLSTTLATNSLLQGKGGAVGLIGIGWKPEPDWQLGASRSRFIAGGHDMRGRPLATLDEEEVEAAVDEACEEMDAMVVSSFFSVVNPQHEEALRRIIQERKGLPVVTGHELTSELGILERTVTAVLNARLLPIIDEFLRGVEASIAGRGISAPIMVFRGDGTLMNLKKARERPVETILSGPAASLMGGMALSRKDRCIVVDIGGTSTDIAYLDQGFPRLGKEGAVVGQWRTRVRAIDIWTAGLGGDSRLDLSGGRIIIGPDRVLPLEVACAENSGLVQRMRDSGELEFLVAYPREPSRLPENERKVFQAISEHGPMTLRELVEGLDGVYLAPDYVKRLKAKSYLISTGLTPTDVLHVAGIYQHGTKEAAELGVELISTRHGMSKQEFVAIFWRSMGARMAEELLKKAVLDASGEVPSGKAAEFLLDAITGMAQANGIDVACRLDRPVVGIGAPAHVYVPLVEKLLGAKVIVPADHDVGNAVGAVCSIVAESVEVQIHKRDNTFFVYIPDKEPIEVERLEQAMHAAKEGAAAYVCKKVVEAGGTDISVLVEVEMKKCRTGVMTSREILNWVEVRARATGKPTIVDRGSKG